MTAQTSKVRDRVTPAEWEARVELAAAYRIMARLRMTDLVYNHITARVPGEEGSFLINAYGLDYSEITASSLYKINLDGDVLLDPEIDFGLNRAGFVIHSAVHAARPDVGCVVHTHTKAGIAVSALKAGLMPLSQNALRFLGRVGYHDYEGPATSLDERARLAANLGDHDALFLRNHGVLVVGPNTPSAIHLTQRLETACQIQIEILATGAEIHIPAEDVQRQTVEMLAPRATHNAIPNGGQVEWAALLRQLDQDDLGYRD